MEVSSALSHAGNLRDDAASVRSIRVEEDSSIALEIIAHDVRFERKLRTRLELGSKIRSSGIFIRHEESQKSDDIAMSRRR